MEEEDIKILEERIELWKNDHRIMIQEDNFKILKAIENLLKAYKKEYKENESKEKAYNNCYFEYKHYKQFDSIPKSKIKEKIEELEEKQEELSDEQGYWGSGDLLSKIDILQELLEEE